MEKSLSKNNVRQELEDTPELKKKLKNCSLLVSEFIKTLTDAQTEKFLEIDEAISNYHASREDFIKSIYEKNL